MGVAQIETVDTSQSLTMKSLANLAKDLGLYPGGIRKSLKLFEARSLCGQFILEMSLWLHYGPKLVGEQDLRQAT